MAVSTTFHYTTKHCTEEAEKKSIDQRAYLFVVITTGSVDLVGRPVLFLPPPLCRLISILGVMGGFMLSDLWCIWSKSVLCLVGILFHFASSCILGRISPDSALL